MSFTGFTNAHGLILHYQDASNYIFISFTIDNENPNDPLSLVQVIGGAETEVALGGVTGDLNRNNWQRLTVAYDGSASRYDVTLEDVGASPNGSGTTIFSGGIVDTTFDSGQVGFGVNFAGASTADEFAINLGD